MTLTNDQIKAFLAQALPIIQATASQAGATSNDAYQARQLLVSIVTEMSLQNEADAVAAAVKELSA